MTPKTCLVEIDLQYIHIKGLFSLSSSSMWEIRGENNHVKSQNNIQIDIEPINKTIFSLISSLINSAST